VAEPRAAVAPDELARCRAIWRAAWPEALAAWGTLIQLRDPAFCASREEAERERLTGSFAMIRLTDHQIVIDLEQVLGYGLEAHAREILAHEIGHHVYCPADLDDNARMLVAVRKSLPLRERHASMTANLFADLLINDRLQRQARLDMAGVYRALKTPRTSPLWAFYLRTYEYLWALESGSLTPPVAPEIDADAALASRVVRVYARDWVTGANRYAALVYRYLEGEDGLASMGELWPLGDLAQSGAGGAVPGGLAEDDDEESVHPAADPRVTGEPVDAGEPGASDASDGDGAARSGRGSFPGRADGRDPVKNGRLPRSIGAYGEILRGLGAKLSDRDVAIAYYRDLAARHLVPFPQVVRGEGGEPQPEGLDVWDFGAELDRVDWLETVLASPVIIPGLTTRERTYGTVQGRDEQKAPLDVYLGIDCSGSMGDPARRTSYPVLAATIIARSALRAGARVMACLSGEPGSTTATDGFVRQESTVMRLVTGYLGTGTTFGIHWLQQHIVDRRDLKPTHLIVVSDSDLFSMLDGRDAAGRLGWQVADAAAARAQGGATFVLELPPHARDAYRNELARMRAIGWTPHVVESMPAVVAFARAFAHELYGATQRLSSRRGGSP
jgi:hypothetical protein